MSRFVFGKMSAWQEHFIMHLMGSNCGPPGASDDFMKKFKIEEMRDEEGQTILDIEVKVNGVSVPYESLVEHHAKTHDSVVRNAAKELVKERVGAMQDKLFRLEEAIKRHVHEIFPDLIDDDDDRSL